jgi:hypothetical protein
MNHAVFKVKRPVKLTEAYPIFGDSEQKISPATIDDGGQLAALAGP